MDAIELLRSRASNAKLQEPAPEGDVLESILEAALRAPDHGLLRPWRIGLLRGPARERLGELFGERMRKQGEPAAKVKRAALKPLRAPLIIVVSAHPVRDHKVPVIEQLISAGALAQNIMLGLHAHGFAGIWRTGGPTYDAEIKTALGLEEGAEIIGFIYAGTPSADAPAMKRPILTDHVVELEASAAYPPAESQPLDAFVSSPWPAQA